jgi:hypothetical protein
LTAETPFCLGAQYVRNPDGFLGSSRNKEHAVSGTHILWTDDRFVDDVIPGVTLSKNISAAEKLLDSVTVPLPSRTSNPKLMTASQSSPAEHHCSKLQSRLI